MRRWANVGIGSRSRQCATSSFVRYCSGSAIECPRKRYVTASTSTGRRSSRTRPIASLITAWVSTTSMPSQRIPGTPRLSPLRCRSVTAE